jgi:hypothetical protein
VVTQVTSYRNGSKVFRIYAIDTLDSFYRKLEGVIKEPNKAVGEEGSSDIY